MRSKSQEETEVSDAWKNGLPKRGRENPETDGAFPANFDFALRLSPVPFSTAFHTPSVTSDLDPTRKL
jgi:hypothetical protein